MTDYMFICDIMLHYKNLTFIQVVCSRGQQGNGNRCQPR